MAPTDDDHNEEEWLLLWDALALVTERCKSQAAAKELLLHLLQSGRIRWGYWQKSGHWPPTKDWGDEPGTPDWRFWHTTPGVTHLEIDWENSSATRTGPVPRSPNWPPAPHDPEPPENFKVSLIRLRHGDVLQALASVFGPLAKPSSTPVPTPTPASTTRTNKAWLASARKTNPRRPGELKQDYGERLHGLMKRDPSVKKLWELETMIRRLRDE